MTRPIENLQKASRGPKFSRLFKLSRSPLKIVKVNEDKKRSKSLDQRQQKGSKPAKPGHHPQTGVGNNNTHPDNRENGVGSLASLPPPSASSNGGSHHHSKKDSKNAPGTSSHSEPSTKSFSRRFSHQKPQQASKQTKQAMQTKKPAVSRTHTVVHIFSKAQLASNINVLTLF